MGCAVVHGLGARTGMGGLENRGHQSHEEGAGPAQPSPALPGKQPSLGFLPCLPGTPRVPTPGSQTQQLRSSCYTSWLPPLLVAAPRPLQQGAWVMGFGAPRGCTQPPGLFAL